MPVVVDCAPVFLRTALALFAAASVPAAAASDGRASVAFVEATSERDDGKPASSMWNVTDDNNGTEWCSAPTAPGKQAINYTFDDNVVVTHVGLMLPHGKDGTDKRVRRPKRVMVADVEHRVEVNLKDTGDLQLLELSEPARGRRVVVEILETYPGEKDDSPVCLAEVSLRNKNRELTGDVAARARALNTPSRRLLHEWHDDLSAPSRTLIFNVDGTFTYRYAPLLEERAPSKVKGKWLADGDTVALEVGGKSYLMKTTLTKVADEGGTTVELALSGDGPDKSMAASFRPAPLLLP